MGESLKFRVKIEFEFDASDWYDDDDLTHKDKVMYIKEDIGDDTILASVLSSTGYKIKSFKEI